MESNKDTFGRMIMPVTDETPNIIDESTENVIYIGFAKRGSSTSNPVWRIKKLETISGITTIGYVNGSLAYNFIWDNRTSYTYL